MYGQDHNEVIRVLAEHYPRCFFDDARQRRPIKKNIIADIEAQKPEELDPYDIQSAIDWVLLALPLPQVDRDAGQSAD